MGSLLVIKCIFTLNFVDTIPSFDLDGFLLFPEKTYSSIDLFNNHYGKVVTTSPFVVGHYQQDEVRIFEDGCLNRPHYETFGSSVDVLMKSLLNVRSTINATSVAAIRTKIKENDDGIISKGELINWIEKLGLSMERAYLISKINNENKIQL